MQYKAEDSISTLQGNNTVLLQEREEITQLSVFFYF